MPFPPRASRSSRPAGEHRAQRERRSSTGSLSRLEPAVIQDVVDELEQVLRRAREDVDAAGAAARWAAVASSSFATFMIAASGVRMSWPEHREQLATSRAPRPRPRRGVQELALVATSLGRVEDT